MTECRCADRVLAMVLVAKTYELKTMRKVPQTGLSLVDWDGKNGTTLTAGVHANKNHITCVQHSTERKCRFP